LFNRMYSELERVFGKGEDKYSAGKDFTPSELCRVCKYFDDEVFPPGPRCARMQFAGIMIEDCSPDNCKCFSPDWSNAVATFLIKAGMSGIIDQNVQKVLWEYFEKESISISQKENNKT